MKTRINISLGTKLHEAAKKFAAERDMDFSELVAAMLRAELENPTTSPIGSSGGSKSAAYLRSLRPRLLAFAQAFPDITTATATAVESWLHSLRFKGRPISPKTFNHFRGAIGLVWKWAAAGGHATPPNPLLSITAFKAPGKREIYTPAELRAILAHAPAEWIPLLALGAFAGLRVCEIGKLHWQDIVWDRRQIRISEETAGKGGSPRNIPMCDALSVWLAPHRQPLGPIYGLTEKALDRQTKKFRIELTRRIPGFRWKQNALRHSYGSYLYATTSDIELVRARMGTSPHMIRHHYNNPQFTEEGHSWFSILPDPAAKILTMPAARGSGHDKP